ncbi:MAG: DUF2238 domain-containing protein [Phycisphaerae bacterium]|nr:DUF2238 domain-containing protein [Phycisphaerae bacterium]
MTNRRSTFHILLLTCLIPVFAWSVINCRDMLTWVLEATPVMIAIPLLIFLYRRFRLTSLVYILIWIHLIILLVGAHYTYAEMPLFNWIRDTFDLSRNHYDRVGHFAQGFVPAMIAREVLLRKSPLQKGKWLAFIVVSICLSISAMYELLEWTAAITASDATVSFLATQGDQWDTQKDMLLCLIGTIAALLTLPRIHDRQLKKLTEAETATSQRQCAEV